MWGHVLSLVPGLLRNKLRHGRYLDIFVSHSPSWGILDGEDFAHQGIKAFRWLVETFQPRYHFHGHVHHYHPDAVNESRLGRTTVINTYPYQVTEFER
jgi:Icc-related predicted phosphoesterase